MSNVWLMGEELVGIRKYNGCIISCGYKPEVRGFESGSFDWNFSLIYSFHPHYDHGFDSASNRNEYQDYLLGCKGSWWVGLRT